MGMGFTEKVALELGLAMVCHGTLIIPKFLLFQRRELFEDVCSHSPLGRAI